MKNFLIFLSLLTCIVFGFVYFNQKNPIGKKIINRQESIAIPVEKTHKKAITSTIEIANSVVSEQPLLEAQEPVQQIEIIAQPVQSPQAQTTKKEIIQTIKSSEDLVEQLTNQKATVIMGSMDGCHFCTVVKPTFKKYAEQYTEVDFFVTNGLKTNMYQSVKEATNDTIKIKGFPAFLFIKNGQIQDHLLGARIEELEKKIRALL